MAEFTQNGTINISKSEWDPDPEDPLADIFFSARQLDGHMVPEKDSLYQSLLENLAAAVMVCDLRGSILMINSTGAEIFGDTPDNLTHRSLFRLLPDLEEEFRKRGREILRTGKSLGYTDWINTKAGKRYFLSKLQPFRNPGGRIVSIQTVSVDITGQKKSEEQLVAKVRKAEKLALVSRLSAGILHEIGNPLYGINSFLEILSGQIQDPTHKKYLDLMTQAAGMIKSLTDTLLDFSQLGKLNPEQIDISRLLKDVVDLSRPKISASKVKVSLEPGHDIPLLNLDPNRIKQVFLNLISNAVEAMPGGGSLEITTTRTDDNVSISFIDTGAGMTDDVRLHLFEPFYSEKKKQGKRGVGLGLFMVSNIIDAHNGQINLETVEGKGSTFEVILPLNG
ncbi:MAG: PAS domain S-box protein [bacterium]|nr:PAS domain S-box protein [bacterium]